MLIPILIVNERIPWDIVNNGKTKLCLVKTRIFLASAHPLEINNMRLNLPILLVALAIFMVEVLIATELQHYHFIRAYFGDFLVVILVYCAVLAIWETQAKHLAIGVFIFACVLELAQLFKLADILELTGIARIILGTSFSFYDIAMYVAGCTTAWYLDSYWRKHISMKKNLAD